MTATSTTRAGMALDRLDRIDGWARRYVDEGRIAGAQVAIARHGETVYHRTFGQRDIERERPTTEDTVYRIYSMSKPITSVALMMLWEEGSFQLDRPAQRYIPSWERMQVRTGGSHPAFMTRPPERAINVRDLLTHTSGLSYGFAPDTPIDAAYKQLGISSDRHAGSLAGLADALADVPLEFSPGTRWKYSLATDMCGHLVELISGQPLDQFLRERIFDPLGMHETGFDVTAAQQDRFAANYERGPDRRLRLGDDPEQSPYLTPATLFSGGGGLVSTTGDYLRFCQMLANGGELDGVRLLGPRTIELMTLNHLPDDQDLTEVAVEGFSETTNAGIGFGLGFAVHIDQAKSMQSASLGSYYWGGAASTMFWVDPLEDLVAVFMTQLMPSGLYDFRRQLHNLVYSAITE